MINKLYLSVNDQDRLELHIPSTEIDIHRYDEIKILLKALHDTFTLYSEDFIIEAIVALKNLLEKVLNNELEVPDSLSKLEIGRLSNDSYQDIEDDLIYEDANWIGTKFNVWSTNNLETWLYNKKGEIYIQVTPVYRWHFAKPKSNDKFSCYSQFVKEYKIIYKAKIERDNAIQWLNKCKEIINIIEMNQRKSEKGRL
ncbi:hypothetical protein PWEIH_14961 [Listeria weihenstephanensis FSL R9-0317]|uniref:Uncharacterized protein n=1 Tax=Listeria weihenstephanensis TaxID=1006155 RepID=A0A1S7FVR3_9LIST|nr:hypothetical protein [Listeria weihenstephanensis]AQY51490.1 hypothetical protein UE46_10895 [Listeria weihenstephanensis]EUJ35854.1 hypothetical protein PWEIH_14961 [Listeria weihenstephanensis FSL R9-0317]